MALMSGGMFHEKEALRICPATFLQLVLFCSSAAAQSRQNSRLVANCRPGTFGGRGCVSVLASAASSCAADDTSHFHLAPLPWLHSRVAASQLLASNFIAWSAHKDDLIPFLF